MRYYRYGGQPYDYEYNWKGYPMAPPKPPMMTFGSVKPWITLDDPDDPYASNEEDVVIIEEPMVIERKKASTPLISPTVKKVAFVAVLGLIAYRLYVTS